MIKWGIDHPCRMFLVTSRTAGAKIKVKETRTGSYLTGKFLESCPQMKQLKILKTFSIIIIKSVIK